MMEVDEMRQQKAVRQSLREIEFAPLRGLAAQIAAAPSPATCPACGSEVFKTLAGEFRHHCMGRFLAEGAGFKMTKEGA
jgi:hypothetical protein